MDEIKCPHCGKVFKVDNTGYAEIVQQIRDHEFERELERRTASAAELAAAKAENNFKDDLSAKESEIADLKSRAVTTISKKDSEIAELKAKLETAESAKKLAITEAVTKIERERDTLANDLKSKETEQKLLETSLREKFASELKNKDEMIAYYKDMKAKMSTKMIGESLEQHCETEFNKLRPTAFQHAYFEKDNAVSKTTGSKGDYIYREADEHGNEIISIMFEMKNEAETTATKHKNEHFFKELDKDRHEKKCEYAVLVSLLEADNDLYNQGIVDVSFQSGFDKMYVIRPQFFITMITLLRNAAMNSLQYKAELALVKEQNIDITNFEERIDKWKDSFAINSDRASKNFNKAIKEIDESIKKLENTRDALIQTVKNFETANKKLDDLTIKKLTRGNPTMAEKFSELKK